MPLRPQRYYLQMTIVWAQLPGRPPRQDSMPLLQALSCADYISLHVPLAAGTESLVNEQFLGALRPDAVLINTVSAIQDAKTLLTTML